MKKGKSPFWGTRRKVLKDERKGETVALLQEQKA
jgi:hypothetical protein